jgi:4'-phosphopantetheinyl transferase
MSPLVQVFWADLDAAAAALPPYASLLSADEKERAERYRFSRDRDRYVVRRALLRLLLGRQLGRAPAALRFTANAWGKLALADGGSEFNLSHSRGLALFALSRDVAVGCDIEFHDRRFLAENIPERLFSATERRELRGFAAEDRLTAFFDGWTRKEAFIKARGLGLSLPLNSFDVALAPGERPALHRGCAGWTARCVAPAPHCSAAVIAESPDWRIDARPVDPLPLLAELGVAA